jgi:hypothetical protein
MKRQYVIPDLLASITADALFGVGVHLHPDEAAALAKADAAKAAARAARRGGRLSWLARGHRARSAASPSSPPTIPNPTSKEST